MRIEDHRHAADWAPELQAALDRGEPLRLGPGRYPVRRVLRLGDGACLELDEGAELAAEGPGGAPVTGGTPLLTNRDHEKGNRGIVLRGGSCRGAVYFRRCRDIRVASLSLRNDGYALTLDDVEDFVVEDVHVDQRGERRVNQDGIHVFGPARRGTIRAVRGTAWDDMVALNADDNDGIHGPIEDVVVDGLDCPRTYNFVRLMSRGSRVDRITVRNVRGTAFVNGGFAIGSHRFDPSESDFGSIRVERVDIAYDNPADGWATFRVNGNVERLEIVDVHRRDAYPTPLVAATGGVRIRELAARGIVRECTDAGAPLTLFDLACRVELLRIEGLTCSGGAPGAALVRADGAASIGTLALTDLVLRPRPRSGEGT